MRARALISAIALLCACALAVAVVWYWNPQWLLRPQYPQVVDFSYLLKVRNSSSSAIPAARFQVLAPVAQTATQRVLSLNVSETYELQRDALGNQSLQFTLKNFPASAERLIKVSVRIAFADAPNYGSRQGLAAFLVDAPMLNLQHAAVQSLARQIGGQPEQYAEQVYQWLTGNLQSVSYAIPDKGAVYALENHGGDCSEFMYAFVALLRAQQHPARSVAGFYRDETLPVIQTSGYHNWAEFYERGRWRVADAQMKHFKQEESRYMAFHILDDASSDRSRDSQAFLQVEAPLQVSLQ